MQLQYDNEERLEQQQQQQESRQDMRQETNSSNTNNTRIPQTFPQYDTTPNRKNEAWGASINNLPPTIFQLYFQNINGLQLQTTDPKWATHLEYMKEKGISISGLAETNTIWQHKNIKKTRHTPHNLSLQITP
jgi:hypothetical protein